MTIFTREPARIFEKLKNESKKDGFSKDTGKKHPTLKELQEKRYLLPGSNL